MNPNAPKENANPTIRWVDPKEQRQRSHSRRTPCGWKDLGTFTKEEDDDDDDNIDNNNDNNDRTTTTTTAWILPQSAEDWAILQALGDISRATHGTGVALLERAGLTLPPTMSTTGGLTGGWRTLPSIRFVDEEEEKVEDESKSISNVKATTTNSTVTTTLNVPPQEPQDRIDAEEVFDIIRNIQDPEHPNTLEQLAVVSLEQVEVKEEVEGHVGVHIRFTPTIPHCSMATLIGLCVTVKLMRSLPSRFKIRVQIEPGTHASERAINKQLRDKERVCAALENKHLAGVVNKCIQQGAESSGR